jgi:hypothetical protein
MTKIKLEEPKLSSIENFYSIDNHHAGVGSNMQHFTSWSPPNTTIKLLEDVGTWLVLIIYLESTVIIACTKSEMYLYS